MSSNAEVYDKVTTQILEALEKKIVPWKMPFSTASQPRSFDGHFYSGINPLLLGISCWTKNYVSPYWGTFNQIKKNGGMVATGEKATYIVLFKPVVKKKLVEGIWAEDKMFIARQYAVFNYDQCEKLKPSPASEKFHEKFSLTEKNLTPPAEYVNLLNSYCAREKIEVLFGNGAGYYTKADKICMPPLNTFHDEIGYVSTFSHEVIHSTGAESRLKRDFNNGFGTDLYAKEELVAEIGAAMLCAANGIAPEFDNSAAYIAGWKKKISDDSRLVISAASLAQKACDFVLKVEAPTLEKEDV